MELFLILIFLALLILGIPVFFVIGLTVILYIYFTGIPFALLVQQLFVGMDKFVLMSVPFFMLAGNLMNAGGLTKRLIRFVNAIVGSLRGGLAYVNILVSMIFAGITGSATADTSSIGSILIPAMKDEGYDVDFSAAVTAASSTIGGIIPPSIPFVIYAVVAGNVSVAGLFMGGIVPGVLIGIFQIILVRFWFKSKCPQPLKAEKMSLKSLHKEARDAVLALIMPIIIIGGILGGIFTPTEASAIACVYALIISLFIYREIKIKDLPKIFLDSAITTGACFLIVGIAQPFGWMLTAEQIPIKIMNLMLSITTNPHIILLLIIIVLLFLGTFMETIAAIIVITPVLLPIAKNMGFAPIHFGLIVSLAIYIGLVTPPVGICLYIASSIAKISLERITKAILPFILGLIAVLLLISYIPDLVLYIPTLLGYK